MKPEVSAHHLNDIVFSSGLGQTDFTIFVAEFAKCCCGLYKEMSAFASRSKCIESAEETHDIDRHARLETQDLGREINFADISKDSRPEPDS